MERLKELRKIFDSLESDTKILINPLIEEIVFLESKLDDLKQYPFIVVNPRNNNQQKTTPAGKQYKEFLQQYSNCIKVLSSMLNKGEGDEESPLRAYMKMLEKRGG